MRSASGSLPRYIVQRLLLVIPMVWVLVTMVFLLLRVAPGDPVSASVGDKLSPEALDARRAALGLDRPLIVQYFDYIGDVATLDFGKTISDNRPITDIIIHNGGATLSLTVGAMLIAVLVGIPLGLLAGRYRDSVGDVVIRLFGVVSYAAPVFWTGLMLIMVVAPLGWPTYE
ncbi:MAG: ABC transporter permease, partial [Actinomycetota bacterium]|nr:ABC transporter permease [Actinomycetota bacterium]